MKRWQIELIRDMIADGRTDDEIALAMREAEIDMEEAEIESRAAQDFEDRAYGPMDDDDRTPYQKEMCDRLDMGRNDAGEWLGFM